MLEFDRLLEIRDTLLGPNGCPWDKEQTLETIKPYILEETHELLEALDLEEKEKIEEELGDCFFTLLFLAKLGENKGIFTLSTVLRIAIEKLIRRHPHVFDKVKVSSTHQVIQNWEEIKKKEGKKNPFSGIPASLPALARAQKIIVKLRRAKKESQAPSTLRSEEELGERLFALVREAETAGIDAESALRRVCLKKEKENE